MPQNSCQVGHPSSPASWAPSSSTPSSSLSCQHGGVPALLQSEGDFVSRRSSGKKEGSRLFGEEEHRLERSSSHFKTKLGENISKKEKFLKLM